jgi:signal transduction histidine kinase
MIVAIVYIISVFMIWLNGQGFFRHRMGYQPQAIDDLKVNLFLRNDQEYYIILLSFSIAISLINLFKLVYCYHLDGEHMIHARSVIGIINLIAVLTLITCAFPELTEAYFAIYLLKDCHGRLGSIFVLLEHLITIPSLFYLCITFNCQKDHLTKSDKIILLLVISFVSAMIICYLVPNIFMITALYSYAMIIMIITCLLLNYSAQTEYQHLLEQASKEKDSAYSIIVRNVANKQRTLCVVLTIMCVNITCLKATRSIFEYYHYEVFFIYNVLFHCNQVIYSTILLTEQREQLYPEYSQLIYEQSLNQSDRKQSQLLIHKIRESMNIIILALHLTYMNQFVSTSSHSDKMIISYDSYNENGTLPADYNQMKSRRKISRSLYESYEMIKEGINFMTGTINDVTSISEIEQGRFRLHFQEFYLVSIIKTAVMSLRGQILEKHIHLQVRFYPNVPIQVVGDSSRIEHTLTNFLSNAI